MSIWQGLIKSNGNLHSGSDGQIDGQSERYRELLRRLFQEERGTLSRDSRTVAVVSSQRGAGVSYTCSAIRDTVNELAVYRAVSRMAAAASGGAHNNRAHNGAHNGAVYGRSSYSAIEEANNGAVSIEPSRMALTIDYRQLMQPGSEFGRVIAESVDAQVLRSHTAQGPTVQTLLDGLSVDWSDDSECRRECLKAMGAAFRVVLIDTPSLKESSAICSIAPLVDGVVVVVEGDKTTRKQLSRLTGAIQASGGRVLGYVLNKRTYPIPEFLYRNLEKMGLT